MLVLLIGGVEMLDTLNVARYIINYSNQEKYGISNLRLQKLLYFVQAYYLISSGNPCFDDRIEAWGFRPCGSGGISRIANVLGEVVSRLLNRILCSTPIIFGTLILLCLMKNVCRMKTERK